MAKTLERKVFELSRECEFFTEKELTMQIGHEKDFWYVALIKELMDNSLDACEVGCIDPEVGVVVTDDYFEVRDNGPGISKKTIIKSLNYFMRISDKQFYVSPTRGQMGNALKTVWAAPYVANGIGKVEVKSKGFEHVIETSLDRIVQRPMIEHNSQKKASVKNGTIVRVYWSNSATLEDEENAYSYKAKPPSIEEIVSQYSVFNPHSSFILGNSKHNARNTNWKKWKTDMPTCIHWYNEYTLRELIAAYVAFERNGNNGKPKTVREFVSEFKGLSSTLKQKKITKGFSGMFLHDLIKDNDIDMDIVRGLLDSMKENSVPVKPYSMGLIGEDNFKSWLKLNQQIIEESFQYSKKSGFDKNNLPYIFEVCFAVKTDPEEHRTIITGLNWTPTLGIPATEISEALGKCSVHKQDPVVLIIHMAKPRFEFVDRGKTRMAL